MGTQCYFNSDSNSFLCELFFMRTKLILNYKSPHFCLIKKRLAIDVIV